MHQRSFYFPFAFPTTSISATSARSPTNIEGKQAIMADALCGPSNSLQTFQKHTSIDRTLQQDRIASRQSAEGFRSTSGRNAGILDAEFEAFQAGQPIGNQFPELQPGFPYGGNTAYFPSSAAQHHSPNWASDFQKLHISSPQLSQPSLLSQPQQQAPQSSNIAGAWYQDLTWQQSQPSAQSQQDAQINPGGSYMHNGILYSNNFPTFGQQHNLLSDPAMQIQSGQQARAVVDDAAFERAFNAATFGQQHNLLSDPAMQIQSGKQASAVVDDAAFERLFNAEITRIKRSEANIQQKEVKAATDVEIEEQLEQISHAAPMTEIPRIGSDRITQQDSSEMLKGEGGNDADELARTASQLLDNLKHDQSRKFKESSFLSLMRQLRDREVRVEGDRLVEASQPLHPGGQYYPAGRDPNKSTARDSS